MRYIKRKYETPVRAWDKQRIESEREALRGYGLRNKKELWRTEAAVRKYRRLARSLAARPNKSQEKLVLDKLVSLGVLEEGAGIDDVLALTTQKFLDRRLQTVLKSKGLANTVKHARQMIVHGHVKVGDRKIVYPSYVVSRGDESKIRIVVAKQTKVEKHAEEKGGEGKTEGRAEGGREAGKEAAAA
jgi:small subunit ribosomal protein S4